MLVFLIDGNTIAASADQQSGIHLFSNAFIHASHIYAIFIVFIKTFSIKAQNLTNLFTLPNKIAMIENNRQWYTFEHSLFPGLPPHLWPLS